MTTCSVGAQSLTPTITRFDEVLRWRMIRRAAESTGAGQHVSALATGMPI